MSYTTWQKSSFSEGQGDNCVELAAVADGIRLRESDEPDTVLRTSPATLGIFIRAVKDGRLDHTH
ncbi:DUF397 domain-containing protein [Streptomyces hygroscopicus]|uniref:DUF397 domain-containing protein n=2 Tax=Streptomyces hygroscopicus TaxID=1912 RepID=UPI0024A5BE0C|nr:DUF397 domain-containing protein [Streptomyces hygroscopicus]GLV79298.1 hypothetical protein Shyhy02_72980 [Streptomyces hygroscopicus subsp. hygroscopicus]